MYMHGYTEWKRPFSVGPNKRNIRQQCFCFNAFLMLAPLGLGGRVPEGCVVSHGLKQPSATQLQPAWSLSSAQPGQAGPLSHPHRKASCWGVWGWGRQRGGGAVGAPQWGPLTRSQTDSTVSAPCRLLLLLSLLSATQTPGAEGETEEGGRMRQREGGGRWANEHNEETDTDYPDPPLLHSSLGTNLSIPYGHAAAAALSSSPLCDPSVVSPPPPDIRQWPALCGPYWPHIRCCCVSNTLFIVCTPHVVLPWWIRGPV